MVEIVGSVTQGDELRIISKEKKDEDKKLGERGQVWIKDLDNGEMETAWINYEGLVKIEGVTKTSRAFGQKFKSFPKILAIAVLLFAFSTMISWSYYGEQAVIYLCGGHKPVVVLAYKIIFCCVVVVGAVSSLGNVVMLSDAMIFAMVIPNMVGLYLLLPVVNKELANFRQHVSDIEKSNK
jgi:AGCS family alanine or glycine:cation symporter